ncbi:hypothetical protein [Amphritea balenae]|uniref:Uncharacterized protein n=1 Tax=Amphritea balenae TaxID=452629 RepID=A0A3P1SSG8_9GAMM|nr:hypothetical protein [Amphritea balenae]RRD00137.1 hypothetical protein EHS89_07990 [Amphritea balenae]GGK76955.1 hypothetical protein GCM10007941_28880 [Amphritea balenae]
MTLNKNVIIQLLLSILLISISSTALLSSVTAAPYENQKDKDLNLHLNGASYHFKRAGHNEQNYGLGFSYKLSDSNQRPDFLKKEPLYFELDIFKDSFSDTGLTAAIAWKKRLSKRTSYGIKAGLWYAQSNTDKYNTPFLPYVVPFLETNYDTRINLRTTIVPPFGDVTYGSLMFQLIIKTDR